jgi:hypothetical protein
LNDCSEYKPKASGISDGSGDLLENGALTVTVPTTFKKLDGHKLLIAPNGADAWAMPRARIDHTMVKALARAHRSKRPLYTGRFQAV